MSTSDKLFTAFMAWAIAMATAGIAYSIYDHEQHDEMYRQSLATPQVVTQRVEIQYEQKSGGAK